MMSTEQTTTTTTSSSAVQIDKDYVKTPGGIIRIVEMVLCFITFIMAVTIYYGSSALGFIQFATISAFLQALVFFLINLFMPSIPSYKPHGTLIELIISAVWVLLLLIAGIIAAVNAHPLIPIIGAIAAFSFFSAVAYGVGCFFLFKDWRSQGGTVPTIPSSTTTTTTTTATTTGEP